MSDKTQASAQPLSETEIFVCDAPPLNEVEQPKKKWDDMTLAEQAESVRESLWAIVKETRPGTNPTVTIGYLYAANICGVLRKCGEALATIDSLNAELHLLREGHARREARRFPIMQGAPKSIPWAMIEPFEHYAQANHYQSLEKLARRGGLDPIEAYAVLNSTHPREIKHISKREAEEWLIAAQAAFERAE